MVKRKKDLRKNKEEQITNESENEEYNDEKINKKIKNKENKQLALVITIMFIIFLAMAITYFVIYKSQNFEYRGLKFKKMKYGEIEFYSVEIPIRDYEGNVIDQFVMNLRKDPRTLDYLTVEPPIKLKKQVALSFDRDLESCDDNIIAVTALARFLSFAGVEPIGGALDKEYANETGIPWITCSDTSGDTTVMIIQNSTEGKETSITETSTDCYLVNIKNCESLEALEKIMIDITARAMGSG